MKVYALSDVHIDYQENYAWLLGLSSKKFTEDILILGGDLTDDITLLEECFLAVREKFSHVFYVPGNHELWVLKDELDCSFKKFEQVCRVAERCGINTQAKSLGELSIVPLFSWYDFSFGQPCQKLLHTWVDFRACQWPNHFTMAEVSEYFLKLNPPHLTTKNKYVISFSHFLPRIDLMPEYIPEKFRFVYPALGSIELDKQIRTLKPNIHVYGHSHVNTDKYIDNIQYINNAFAYPTEHRIARKQLLCIYETEG